MLSQIFIAKEANEKLKTSILCCREYDESGTPYHKFLTNNKEFIDFLNKKHYDNVVEQENSENNTTADILGKRYIESVFFPAFLGEVSLTASLTKPQYNMYVYNYIDFLKTNEHLCKSVSKIYNVDFSKDIFYLEDFSKVNENDYHFYDSDGLKTDSDSKIPVVSNFNENDFILKDAFLILSEKNGFKISFGKDDFVVENDLVLTCCVVFFKPLSEIDMNLSMQDIILINDNTDNISLVELDAEDDLVFKHNDEFDLEETDNEILDFNDLEDNNKSGLEEAENDYLNFDDLSEGDF